MGLPLFWAGGSLRHTEPGAPLRAVALQRSIGFVALRHKLSARAPFVPLAIVLPQSGTKSALWSSSHFGRAKHNSSTLSLHCRARRAKKGNIK